MITGRRRTVAPTDPVVTLATMQQHLRLDLSGSPPAHPDDDLVEGYVQAAVDDLEGEDGWLGRALMPQTWSVTFDGFPCATKRNPDAALFLPFPPLIEVLSVTYLDSGGTVRTMTEGVDYEAFVNGDPHGFIAPLFLQTWPVTGERFNAVTVTFRCGYDETSSPANAMPETIREYVQVLAGLMYENRELGGVNMNFTEIEHYKRSIQRFRVYGP